MRGGQNHLEYLLGLTPKQFIMFQTLQKATEKTEDISRKELHEMTSIDSATIARTLSKLMQKGLVHREYALSENAPPHYRYKPLGKIDYCDYVAKATYEFIEAIYVLIDQIQISETEGGGDVWAPYDPESSGEQNG